MINAELIIDTIDRSSRVWLVTQFRRTRPVTAKLLPTAESKLGPASEAVLQFTARRRIRADWQA